MSKKYWRRKSYGIQGKFLFRFVMLLFCTALPMIVFILGYVSKSLRTSFAETYTYRNEKIYDSFLNYYEKVDADMGQFVLNASVQGSLKNGELTMEERDAVLKVLAYMGEHSDYYLYIDNQGRTYSQKNIDLDENALEEYDVFHILENEYAKTKFSFCKDELFGGEEKRLFASRYVRPLNYDYSPGILCLRLNFDEFGEIIDSFQDDGAYYMLLDQDYETCYVETAAEKAADDMLETVQQNMEMLSSGQKQQLTEYYNGDLYVCMQDENTGFRIAVYVPESVVLKEIYRIERGMIIICFCALLLAFLMSIRFSKRLTSPIREISQCMKEFDETRLGTYLDIQTSTELDIIGNSYNHMIDQVGELLDEVKRKEKELRESEMESLVYQIQPHFLYNTLDTIYMLARLSKETKIMNMIYSLSKMLRINLSKGEDEIFVERELEHVKAYMEIQKIRNDDLFTYEIICDENAKRVSIVKMILQPLAENCIKHGFKNMLKDGHIRIQVKLQGEMICILVSNDGDLISRERLELMNQLERIPIGDFAGLLPGEEGGYGIKNIVKRLRLKYDGRIRFYYEVKDGWTICHIEIPANGGEHV